MKIESRLIELAYDISKSNYNKILSKTDAIERLCVEGMNAGSAFIYIQVFQHLLDGELYKRTLNAKSFDYFLYRIEQDYGKDQLAISLAALKNHIDYFEGLKNYKMGLVRRVYEKYLAIAKENIEIETDYDLDEASFPEGKEKYRLHKSKERNKLLIKLAKERYQKIDEEMHCQVCNFSFIDVYGEIGKGFIEAHHITPISQLSEQTATRLEDLVMVCSNCHRMLHRKRPWLNMNELKTLYKK